MPLEVQIEKKLPDFTLTAGFQADDARPLSILGPSGAGKSMLLRCLAGLENPDRGRIVLNDRLLFDSTRAVRVPTRMRRIGLLFQHYALFPKRSVAQNLAFGIKNLPVAEREKTIRRLAERAHIQGLEHRFPMELSGGEQQRVALARALAVEPEALLLDEPLSSLDAHLRSQIETLLLETFHEYRRPTLLVTHNIEEAYRLCDRLLVLSRGRVAAFGDKEEIFRRPPTVEVARLTGCKNISRATRISEDVVEATDWHCRLRTTDRVSPAPAYVGIRAHYIDFDESSLPPPPAENVFPCWLVRSSETPFGITLLLTLREPDKADAAEIHLQAEVSKERWERFRGRPQPWHVRLRSSSLFLMPG
jgi:molybdate transport system permease protein